MATLASAGKLPEALITETGLWISPIRQNDTDVDDIARRLYGMLPRRVLTHPTGIPLTEYLLIFRVPESDQIK